MGSLFDGENFSATLKTGFYVTSNRMLGGKQPGREGRINSLVVSVSSGRNDQTVVQFSFVLLLHAAVYL